jgi:ferredoxin-NADP reductase
LTEVTEDAPGVGSAAEHTCTVADRIEAADGVVALVLQAGDRGSLPAWTPGAHIDLLLAPGLTRQYSLCGDPADRESWRIAVLCERAGRGGSAYVHDELRRGSPVRVRGPRNNFELVDADRLLFIAGGIGITPILPMIAAADESGTPWSLLYGGRTLRSMAFVEELARYGDAVTIRPQDEYGLLDLESVLASPSPDTAVYCCGPEPLLGAVEQRCRAWSDDRLHFERFTPQSREYDADRPIEVELARSGLTFVVDADQSILDACLEAGVDIASSCEEGLCRTCETLVLAGRPDHRDSVLSEAERSAEDRMMVCVSRAHSDRLVLDL